MYADIPPKNSEFNESVVFPDEATGRLTRRLTRDRQSNAKPTYHGMGGFSVDDEYTAFCTWNDDASALVRVNIETGDCKVIDRAEVGDEFQFEGCAEFIPQTHWVVKTDGSKLRVYDSRSSNIVYFRDYAGEGFLGGAAGTCDGKSLIVIRNDHSFSYVTDKDTKDPYGVLGYSIFLVDLDTGREERIFRDEKFKGGHPIPNPCDPNLLLFNRDSPPLFSHGGDHGKTSRDWVLNIQNGQVTEIRPGDPSKFSLHSNWSYKGDHVYYHGLSGDQSTADRYSIEGSPYKDGPGTNHFIGVAKADGESVWENQYPYMTYGHVSTHRQANVIIVDNLLAYEYISGIHWEDRDSDDIPRVELLAKHNSTYAQNDQTRHPHCTMTSDGKWLCYNAKFDNRSDVYVVKMK
ncbi:MAG TPA: hypothetical protein DHW45_09655 [Candidatus Latescibacteria bacterium]|nr:hypothetical protein [Candidatus Latescibacterota bacterium]